MPRSLRPARTVHQSHRRGGFTTPAVAVALLVIMMGLALIIDRIWLETAKLELITATESAALAAAHELASDDNLLANTAVDLRIQNAREAAAAIAAQNFVCGVSVTLNTDVEGDVRFGCLVQEAEGTRFEESDKNPTTVVVTALRTRSNNNPVALFITGVTRLPYGDVAARVEATISNDVVGLRPIDGTPIPALPIGILEADPSGERSDTWDKCIEARSGADQYTFDSETHSVVPGPDGIPELMIRSLRTGGDPSDCNLQLLDFGTSLNDTDLARQFESGFTAKDLKAFSGSLYVGQGTTFDVSSSPQFDANQLRVVQSMIGQRRICFLYSQAIPQRQPPMATSTCTRPVAIRIMAVNGHSDGSCEIVVQPTVMTTRNAILASESELYSDPNMNFSTSSQLCRGSSGPTTVTTSQSTTPDTTPNCYLYKLRLTQ